MEALQIFAQTEVDEENKSYQLQRNSLKYYRAATFKAGKFLSATKFKPDFDDAWFDFNQIRNGARLVTTDV
ncbi:hypothetical protein GD1_168 [Paraglaciecola Antarctic GD virus 1]|nr:hypothetical protein GD1_168 [Paraglaciecola Antarctic GD virus 1]